MRYALIPVKDLAQAKARLAPALDSDARRELALALFRDVLAAARACGALDGVAVVSRDEEALAVATEAGAEGLPEPGSLNDALTSAAEQLAGRGAERIVVLAADLPLARADDIAAVLDTRAGVALTPSRDGGTNAISLAPGAIPFLFGPDSAARHLAAAREAGMHGVRLEIPGLALDIDTPDDLERLRAVLDEAGEHTRAVFGRPRIDATATRP
jgi:2-phospho-L-lactate guanylyltransferase